MSSSSGMCRLRQAARLPFTLLLGRPGLATVLRRHRRGIGARRNRACRSGSVHQHFLCSVPVRAIDGQAPVHRRRVAGLPGLPRLRTALFTVEYGIARWSPRPGVRRNGCPLLAGLQIGVGSQGAPSCGSCDLCAIRSLRAGAPFLGGDRPSRWDCDRAFRRFRRTEPVRGGAVGLQRRGRIRSPRLQARELHRTLSASALAGFGLTRCPSRPCIRSLQHRDRRSLGSGRLKRGSPRPRTRLLGLDWSHARLRLDGRSDAGCPVGPCPHGCRATGRLGRFVDLNGQALLLGSCSLDGLLRRRLGRLSPSRALGPSPDRGGHAAVHACDGRCGGLRGRRSLRAPRSRAPSGPVGLDLLRPVGTGSVRSGDRSGHGLGGGLGHRTIRDNVLPRLPSGPGCALTLGPVDPDALRPVGGGIVGSGGRPRRDGALCEHPGRNPGSAARCGHAALRRTVPGRTDWRLRLVRRRLGDRQGRENRRVDGELLPRPSGLRLGVGVQFLRPSIRLRGRNLPFPDDLHRRGGIPWWRRLQKENLREASLRRWSRTCRLAGDSRHEGDRCCRVDHVHSRNLSDVSLGPSSANTRQSSGESAAMLPLSRPAGTRICHTPSRYGFHRGLGTDPSGSLRSGWNACGFARCDRRRSRRHLGTLRRTSSAPRAHRGHGRPSPEQAGGRLGSGAPERGCHSRTRPFCRDQVRGTQSPGSGFPTHEGAPEPLPRLRHPHSHRHEQDPHRIRGLPHPSPLGRGRRCRCLFDRRRTGQAIARFRPSGALPAGSELRPSRVRWRFHVRRGVRSGCRL